MPKYRVHRLVTFVKCLDFTVEAPSKRAGRALVLKHTDGPDILDGAPDDLVCVGESDPEPVEKPDRFSVELAEGL